MLARQMTEGHSACWDKASTSPIVNPKSPPTNIMAFICFAHATTPSSKRLAMRVVCLDIASVELVLRDYPGQESLRSRLSEVARNILPGTQEAKSVICA